MEEDCQPFKRKTRVKLKLMNNSKRMCIYIKISLDINTQR